MTEIAESSLVDDCVLSVNVVALLNSASVQNEKEAITVLLHTFMLESGFVPKGISSENKYKSMPDGWNKNGIFRLKYEHFCCQSFTCCMTCVPLYKTISVHGIISDVDCLDKIDIVINVLKYVNKSKDFSNISDVFCNLKDLSIYFKDNFCLPLLNLLHATIGKSPLYGILGLFEELKIHILQMLPVEGVVSVSAVNKEFHNIANLSSLWKYLYMRDFAKGSLSDTDTASSKTNWKQMYRKEYQKTKKKFEPRRYIFPQSIMPEIFNVGPDYETDIGINFDPPYPGPSIFGPPILPPRFPPLFRRFL